MKAAYDRRGRRARAFTKKKKIGGGPPPVEQVVPKKVGPAPKPAQEVPKPAPKPAQEVPKLVQKQVQKPAPKPVQRPVSKAALKVVQKKETTLSKVLTQQPVKRPVTKNRTVQQEKRMVNDKVTAESDIKAVLRQQQALYNKSIKEHRRASAWVIAIISFLLVAAICGFTYFIVSSNKIHKQNVEQLIARYEEEKTYIIDTAFNIKNTLIGEYYIDDKKQFEDFMLNGARVIARKYDQFAVQIKQKKFTAMSKAQMADYLEITYTGAKLVGIDPYLLLAIDYIESEYNLKAKSSVGALGICQFMPLTAKLIANARTNYTMLEVDGYDRAKLFDPVYSKKLQIRFMKHLFDTYDGRVEWALLAYNWGPGKTTGRWWGNGEAVFTDLDDEQKEYAGLVLRIYNKIKSNEASGNEEA